MDDYIEANMARFRRELRDLLSIPSVSTDRRHEEDVRRCALWLVERLQEIGVADAQLVETERHPLVLARHGPGDGAPTVLVYGHYDVQPSEPDELWTSPPFEPTERGGRIYARGAVDDKGPVHMHLKALESILRTGTELPLNVVLLLEGEEEVGSPSFPDFLTEHGGRLECDAVLVSDTAMLAPEIPCITTGMRGVVYTEIVVRGPQRDLHSGHYGGVAVNPAGALNRILAGLHDDSGRITVPGFYDAVRPVTEDEHEGLDTVPFSQERLARDIGAPAVGGERGLHPLERIWYRPTLDVHGLHSGFSGEGIKTIIPRSATAKVSMRIVADQDPDEIAQAFEAHVGELAPRGVEVEVRCLGLARPWRAEPRHPAFRVAAAALEEAFGNPPAFTHVGGTIPILPTLAAAFDVPFLMVGFSLPDGNLHAPDESLDLEVYRRGIHALARLYAGLTESL